MSRASLEAELSAFKNANPHWMTTAIERELVLSYHNRFLAMSAAGNAIYKVEVFYRGFS
jgi:hypothetical protein